MARLFVRSGIHPSAPEVPLAVLLVDPEGSAGERAVVRLGAYCHEVDGWACLLQTDGWAEQVWVDGELVVGVAVYPVGLRAVNVDPADFPERSAVDPRAVIVLTVRTAAAPVALDEGTVVYTAAPGAALDEVLAGYPDWPMVLAPPPQE
ncbi:hypothetical protein GCM10009665_49010 [Kitasatospora nipponensis]|uniref:Immunity protein 21 of polymorphic toxin system n=1 Tax=Kitasatospora nipponensis TaxID=258049 RepID=A0ABN1WN20_9ACTN